MKFLKKIFSSSLLLISLILFFYTFYQSEIHWNGEQRDYYLTYYLISSLLIFFSILSFFISSKLKEYLIISVISLVFSLYIVEGYFTLEEYLTKRKILNVKLQNKEKEKILKAKLYKKQTGNEWDSRTKLQIYEDLKKENHKITVTVAPENFFNKNYPLFPLSGISKTQTIYCNENGYYSIYLSDRYGLNNPDNQWDQKEIEYLLLGDSFTHGACVNRPYDIASVLRNLSNKSSLNLGYASSGPLTQYAVLREYLKKNVKKVIWIYFEGNDLVNLSSELKYKSLTKYLYDINHKQNLKYKQNEINQLAINYIENKRKEEIKKFKKRQNLSSKIKKFIKIYKTRILIQKDNLPKISLPLLEFKKILRQTNDLTIKNNSKLYFVYLPEYQRYNSNYDNKHYNLIKNIVSEINIPFIDVHKEVFMKEEDALSLFPFKLNGHYNLDGYNKVAKIIFKYTKD